MKNKTKSCDRCILRKVFPDLSPEPKNHDVNVSPAYMRKKIEDLHKQDIKWKRKRQKLFDQKQAVIAQEQMEQCTFQPRINGNTDEFYIPNDPFLKRQREWKIMIDKKVSKQRQIKEKQEVKKLTFKPKISEIPATNRELTYSNRTKISVKSYKNMHVEKLKWKQLSKTLIKEPFQHRKTRSMVDAYFEMNRSNKEVNKLGKSQILQLKNPEQYMSLNGMLIPKVQQKEEIIDELEEIQKHGKTKEAEEDEEDEKQLVM